MSVTKPLSLKKNIFSVKILSVLFGSMVESYDFALYGLSAKNLANYFFFLDDPNTALMKTFGIFIAAALSKPLGAILFGHIGDRFGRSIALKMTLIGIAVPTLMIGLLPSVKMFGSFAAILLLLCRMLQGMFKIGEADGVRIYLYEQLQDQPSQGKYRYVAVGLLNLIGMSGVVFASIAVSMTQGENLAEWVWRLPFIIGGLLGILMFMIRMNIEETLPFFKLFRKNAVKKHKIRKHKQ